MALHPSPGWGPLGVPSDLLASTQGTETAAEDTRDGLAVLQLDRLPSGDLDGLVPTQDDRGQFIPEWKRQVMVRKLQARLSAGSAPEDQVGLGVGAGPGAQGKGRGPEPGEGRGLEPGEGVGSSVGRAGPGRGGARGQRLEAEAGPGDWSWRVDLEGGGLRPRYLSSLFCQKMRKNQIRGL